MISFLITVIKLLIILGVVATIHEFGHFLFAKLFKMGVNEFSIGFGPKIVQKKFKDTMYSLRCIPLGGYCAIEGEDGDSQREDSFANKSAFAKIIVLIAGVLFNAILAAVIFISIGFATNTYNTKLTNIEENSVLSQAGLQVGDEIYSVNGDIVHLADDLMSKRSDFPNDVQIEYIRNGEKYTTTIKDATKNIGYIGVSFLINTEGTDVTNQVEMIASGGAAAEAGLKAQDKILAINGTQTNNSTDIVNIVRDNAGNSLNFTIERDGQVIEKTLVPKTQRYFDLGSFATEKVEPNLKFAMYSAINNFTSIIGSYVDLFKGNVSVNEMSGIVGIGEVVSKTEGILSFLNLLGIISLAVGVANIMPFPPLDGGKIVIVLIETITRKKVPLKVEAIISYIGFALLIVLTLFVTYNDIVRII